ncbi:adenine-specific methyltransferase [Psychrobacter sp. JCM 18901]|nr:adenine-specific methyltransferase [Psychrobacter sp. JCM 18901]
MIDRGLFSPPFVIMKKGQHKKRITASYIDYFSYCTTACYVFNGNATEKDKKTLVCVLNSKVMTYLLFLTSSSWGIEREQIFMDEILESPALMPLLSNETLLLLENKFNEIKTLKSDFHLANRRISEIEQEIDSILVSDIFGASEDADFTINDNLTYSLDLFDKQSQSIALHTVQKNQIMDYSKVMIDKLNAFIEGQNLYVNATVFDISHYSPLMMVKLSFSEEKETIHVSNENVSAQLKQLDEKLWEEKASNIYVRKILNYKSDDDIFIVRPNQRRFWSKSMAMEDGSNLILEILNGV